jgi:hypothetical protein
MNKCPCEIRYDAVPACACRPAGYAKSNIRIRRLARRRPAIWSVGQSAFRAIAAVTQQAFHSPQGRQAEKAGVTPHIARPLSTARVALHGCLFDRNYVRIDRLKTT